MENTTAGHNLKVSDIDASLNGGRFHTGKSWNVTFIIMLVLSSLVIISALIGLADPPYDNSKFMIIFGSAFGGFMLLVTLLTYLYVNRGKRKVALWLKDAVLLEAKCTLLDTRLEVRKSITAMAAYVRVKFSYNGKNYTRESAYKGDKLYLPVYYKYADRKIKIAYSPKYDQVMLIKDNKK